MRGIRLDKIAEKMNGANGAECKVWTTFSPFFCCFSHHVGLSCLTEQAVCTEAGMYALRERRIHVTQEDFEMAVAKVMKKDSEKDVSILKLFK